MLALDSQPLEGVPEGRVAAVRPEAAASAVLLPVGWPGPSSDRTLMEKLPVPAAAAVTVSAATNGKEGGAEMSPTSTAPQAAASAGGSGESADSLLQKQVAL